MNNRFHEFSYEEREILGVLLNNEGVPCLNDSEEIMKNLYDELNTISKKEVFENYDWEIIGWNDDQENIVIPLSQKNAGLFLKVLNVKLQRNRH